MTRQTEISNSVKAIENIFTCWPCATYHIPTLTE
jgi:hypothetical protein